MSCFTCPLRPMFENRLEAERDQSYAEAQALYETSQILRQAEAEELMNMQPDESGYMDDTDTMILKIQAQRLAMSETIGRANYLTSRNTALAHYLDSPDRAQLEAEDAICNGPRTVRSPRIFGEKIVACTLERRVERARVFGWVAIHE